MRHHKWHLKLMCLDEMTRPARVTAGVRATKPRTLLKRRPPGGGKAGVAEGRGDGLCAMLVKV